MKGTMGIKSPSIKRRRSAAKPTSVIELLESRRLLSASPYSLLAKVQIFDQISNLTPLADSTTPYSFNAEVREPSSSISSASITPPSGPVVHLSAEGNGSSHFGFQEGFNSRPAMTAVFANHTYTLSLNDTGGAHAYTLNFTTNSFPTSVPQIFHYAPLQQVDPSQTLSLTWHPFAGGTSNDFIQLSISDSNGNNVFSSPQVTSAGALDGTATGVNVPASTLQGGTTYTARLIFAKIVQEDTTDYPGVPGIVAFSNSTTMPIVTIGGGIDQSGTLNINGTAGNDTIAVSNDLAGHYIVTENSLSPQSFDIGSVNGIKIFGGAGDDLMLVKRGVNSPATLFGGLGNDTLLGRNGGDFLNGGAGNDSIQGLAGNDTLYGGQGTDTLTVVGSLSGGNLLEAGPGNSLMFANEGFADTLFGGVGQDTAHVDAGGIDSIPNSDITDVIVGP
jgi:hypothetical protein